MLCTQQVVIRVTSIACTMPHSSPLTIAMQVSTSLCRRKKSGLYATKCVQLVRWKISLRSTELGHTPCFVSHRKCRRRERRDRHRALGHRPLCENRLDKSRRGRRCTVHSASPSHLSKSKKLHFATPTEYSASECGAGRLDPQDVIPFSTT